MVLTEIQSHPLFYYMSKSEVSDILLFFWLMSHHKKNKKYAVPQGNKYSYPPVTFTGRWIKFKANKQNVVKGKQRGVDIKQEDVLQAVVRKTLIG